MTLAAMLHNARSAAGISQRRLAAELGLDQSMVSRVERGEASTTLENADRWLALCGRRLIGAPADGFVPEEITTLPAEQRELLLRLARILTTMPVEQQGFLADQVDLWGRRYGSQAPVAPLVVAEPGIIAARGR